MNCDIEPKTRRTLDGLSDELRLSRRGIVYEAFEIGRLTGRIEASQASQVIVDRAFDAVAKCR